MRQSLVYVPAIGTGKGSALRPTTVLWREVPIHAPPRGWPTNTHAQSRDWHPQIRWFRGRSLLDESSWQQWMCWGKYWHCSAPEVISQLESYLKKSHTNTLMHMSMNIGRFQTLTESRIPSIHSPTSLWSFQEESHTHNCWRTMT